MLTAFIAYSASAPLLESPVPIFLAVLLIILLTPMLLNKLKIPHVIGLIIAGVIVGPYGFNLLARDMSFQVFGQVGLLYLMFLAGIEIDMFHLKRNLKKGMVFGLFTFFVPLILGAVSGHFFLHLDVLTSLLLAAMFAAHTLIAYPLVSRFGLTKSPAVVIAIAGTIFTVLGSLIVLAGVVGVFREGALHWGRIMSLLGGLVLYCLVVVYAYPRITRWFFKRYSDNILQFIYVLLMVFLGAQTAVLIGIEGVFGAFFSGIVLNRYVPMRSPLMTRLEFVGNAIFIPYFLIGVGMLINIRSVADDWSSLYVATIMAATAMATKWIAAWITQRIYHLESMDRSILYQLSNAHTAVALAVVMIGYEMGLFGEDILNGTIIMILVTCTVSSIGTARAAQKLKIRQLSAEDELISKPGTARGKAEAVRNILIAIASPITAPELVDMALMMRGRRAQQSHIFALHVRNDNSPSSRAIGRNSLDMAEQTAASVDAKISTIERYDLNFITGVTNTIEERDIDSVIIGLHRRNNFIDSFFGDKVDNLLKATNKMVMISRLFIPLNTVTRIVVMVPDKAQFETGFVNWVQALANLTRLIGCRLIFCCFADTQSVIEAVLRNGRFDMRYEYRTITDWDDFILMANKVLDDDLFVVINARHASLSYNAEMDGIPSFLQKYFAQNNLLIIYPEQFGEQPEMPSVSATQSTDVITSSSRLWVRLSSYHRRAIALRKRFTHRNRTPRIDL